MPAWWILSASFLGSPGSPPKLSVVAGDGGRQQNMLLKDLTKNSTSIGMAVNASNATVASNQATLNNAAGVTSSSADVRVTTRRATWCTTGDQRWFELKVAPKKFECFTSEVLAVSGHTCVKKIVLKKIS